MVSLKALGLEICLIETYGISIALGIEWFLCTDKDGRSLSLDLRRMGYRIFAIVNHFFQWIYSLVAAPNSISRCWVLWIILVYLLHFYFFKF